MPKKRIKEIDLYDIPKELVKIADDLDIKEKTREEIFRETVHRYAQYINNQIYEENRPIKEALAQKNAIYGTMSDKEFAKHLLGRRSGRGPIEEDEITTPQELKVVRGYFQRNPIHHGEGWSESTRKDISNLMRVNDIDLPEHATLRERMKKMTDQEARYLLHESVEHKNTAWISETNARSHITGKHVEYQARELIRIWLEDINGLFRKPRGADPI